jgi:hypothetical protein
VTGVPEAVVDGTVDATVAGSVVLAAEPGTVVADDGAAAGDEEQPAKVRYRQPTAASLLAPQAVTAIGLARF